MHASLLFLGIVSCAADGTRPTSWSTAQEQLNATVVRLARAQLTNTSPWRFDGVGYRMVTHQGFVLVHGSQQYEVAAHPGLTFSNCVASSATAQQESELGAEPACGALSSGRIMATSIEFWRQQSTVRMENVGISCVGFTFNVALDALGDHSVLGTKTVGDMIEFKRQWFIEEQRDRRGLVHALTTAGLGRRIELDEARSGDFAQFWRLNGSGHAVVITEIVRRDGQIVGLRYISAQESTRGVAEKAEFFSDAEGVVDRDRCHLARLRPQVK